jgi:hypothetical protein
MTGSSGISRSNEGSEISMDATESIKDCKAANGAQDRRRLPRGSHDTCYSQHYREILHEGKEIEQYLGLAMRVVPCASSSTIDAGSEGLHAEVGNRPVAGECFHQ